MTDVINDTALAQMLAQHDPGALEMLYQYARLLEVVLYHEFDTRISEEDRKDIVADTLVRAWETGARFDPRLSSLKTWLIMRATYEARNFLRKNFKQDKILRLEDSEEVPAPELSVQPCDRQYPSERIARILALLPARRAKILELYYYGGYPVAEISRMLQISEGGVRSHLSHARASLRQELEAEPLEP